MTDVLGERVFFKRRAAKLLRSYWCHRWDNVELRSALSKDYEPKYYVESEHLDGYYLKLQRLDFLWYRGIFSLGRHLESGRYIKDPVHLPVRGFGPRELVFPTTLTGRLSRVTLVGTWMRYQTVTPGEENAAVRPELGARGEPVTLAVREVRFAVHQPLVTWWGVSPGHKTLCLDGMAVNTKLEGQRLVVPIREVFWNALHGYRERYLTH